MVTKNASLTDGIVQLNEEPLQCMTGTVSRKLLHAHASVLRSLNFDPPAKLARVDAELQEKHGSVEEIKQK